MIIGPECPVNADLDKRQGGVKMRPLKNMLIDFQQVATI